MRVTAIPPESQTTMRWRNGGGLTREIYSCPAEGGFRWRASVARIDSSGPFSAFPGFQRWTCLLDGGPLRLRFDDAELELQPRLRAFSYSGAAAPAGHLDGEFAIVFNLMVADDLPPAQLMARPLVGSMVIFDQADTDWLIYMISGEAHLRIGEQRRWIGEQHALLLHGEGGGARALLDGGGEVVLVKISRAA